MLDTNLISSVYWGNPTSFFPLPLSVNVVHYALPVFFPVDSHYNCTLCEFCYHSVFIAWITIAIMYVSYCHLLIIGTRPDTPGISNYFLSSPSHRLTPFLLSTPLVSLIPLNNHPGNLIITHPLTFSINLVGVIIISLGTFYSFQSFLHLSAYLIIVVTATIVIFIVIIVMKIMIIINVGIATNYYDSITVSINTTTTTKISVNIFWS